MKTLFMTTAAAALMANLAIAQDAPTDAPADVPMTQPEAEATEAPAETPTDAPAEMATGTATDFADMAVADVVGQDVLADTGADVGEVERLIDVGGEVQAVVGVGGFLGLGEHDVAIALSDFVETDNGLMLPGLTEEDLMAMAAYAGDAPELPMDVTVSGEAIIAEPMVPVDPIN